MKKILFLSRDPGGTNVLIPIIQNMRPNYKIVVFAKDRAYERYSIHGIDCSKIEDYIEKDSISEIKTFLRRIAPDIVITGTSSDDFIERYMWLAARELSIKSVAILDSWCNYGIRFSRYSVQSLQACKKEDLIYCPDYVVVMDECAKIEMQKVGMNEKQLVVCGQPYLQYIRESYQKISQERLEKYREELCGNKVQIILFVSDNLSDAYPSAGEPYWGYDEKSIFLEIVHAIEKTCNNFNKYLLLIRPHPKENIDFWKECIRNNKTKIQMKIDHNSNEGVVIRASDLIIGMWSMFLLEAAIAQKRIISVQIGATKKAPFLLAEKGFVEPIFTRNKLEETLSSYFINGNMGIINWEINNNATKNVVDFVNSII